MLSYRSVLSNVVFDVFGLSSSGVAVTVVADPDPEAIDGSTPVGRAELNDWSPCTGFVLEEQLVSVKMLVHCPVLADGLRQAIRRWASGVSLSDVFGSIGSSDAPDWTSDCSASIPRGHPMGAAEHLLTLPVHQRRPLQDLAAASAKDRKIYSAAAIVLSSLHDLVLRRHFSGAERRADGHGPVISSKLDVPLIFPVSLEYGGSTFTRGKFCVACACSLVEYILAQHRTALHLHCCSSNQLAFSIGCRRPAGDSMYCSGSTYHKSFVCPERGVSANHDSVSGIGCRVARGDSEQASGEPVRRGSGPILTHPDGLSMALYGRLQDPRTACAGRRRPEAGVRLRTVLS